MNGQDLMYLIGGACSIFVVIYLTYALIYAEEF